MGAARWTTWDVRTFGRAARAALVALALAWLVTAATDEGGVPWGERAGRTLPLAPVCAALGASVALAPMRRRGDVRALSALGRSKLEIAAAAVAGGALVAFAAALAIGLLRRVDVTGFYPTATHASAWRWDGAGFVSAAGGLRVGADGAPVRVGAGTDVAAASLPWAARAAAALTLALAGLALPLLLTHAMLTGDPDRRFGRRDVQTGLAAALAVAASVILFQAAAARQAPALAAAVPALGLLALAARRYRASP